MNQPAPALSVNYLTREEWLNAAAQRLAEPFAAAGVPLPERLRLTCGWPSSGGKGKQRRTLAECWRPEASADGTVEVFVSPVLADARAVFAAVVHELIHGAGIYNHRAEFKRAATALGLTGPAKTTVPADDFDARYADDLARLGVYPHAALTPGLSGVKKQGTRMLKACCSDASCGYTVRLTRKWADVGMPSCPCGAGELVLDDDSGDA